jgi:RNA polymerase sigma-70 factor, ECF subfamily
MAQFLATHDEANLLEQLRAGNDDAYTHLYDRYERLLYGVILRIVGNRNDAENLVQDSFVKIWRHLHSFDVNKGRLVVWMANIARNTAIDYTRSKIYKQRKNDAALDGLFQDNTHDNNTTVTPMETLDLREVVNRLEPAQKQVIDLMYFEGYTQQEISDHFDIPLGTVKTRTRSAMQTLRIYFDTYEH